MRLLRPLTSGVARDSSALRRTLSLSVSGVLGLSSLALVAASQVGAGANSVCGPDAEVLRIGNGPVACVHADEAPPGVDVTDHVTTAELKSRDGGGLEAYEAAQELGIPMAVASTATSPAVTCDGDGTSGYRVQAMYVVESNATNRFNDLKANFKLWAAGTDDVINRSAALTGGVRHIRYVTEAGANSTCEAKVLNVTVPAGSMASFNATIQAVQALGYTSSTRKYLMWTDASVLCGIATMYPNDGESQANPNNGSYAQYARVDTGCWGGGNGTTGHSVEAHELVHNLGGVQNSAPHSTNAGHCWDEADTMCYADGGNHAMAQVCPTDREYLLDCNTDDYFSTYPDPGSYLDSHWNSADNRFLIGGGDGSGGGSTGAPTVLGATIGVNNPAVPGLATQAEVTPTLPSGRTLTSVTWTSKRADCSFSEPTSLQTDVTCAAAASGSTTVTAVLVDSSGATKTVSSPLSFATGTTRPINLALSVAGQAEAEVTTASVCTGAAFPIAVAVTDSATGLPIKGLAATFSKTTAAKPAPASAGTGTSLASGIATASGSATVATTYAAAAKATAVYAAGTSESLEATPGVCATDLSGEVDADEIYYGESVTVSGDLTREVAGDALGVAGVSLPVRITYEVAGKPRVVTLGTAKTAADGSYSVAVKPTVSGALSVNLAASAGYAARTVSLGAVVVNLPETELNAEVDLDQVAYGKPIVVTGDLTKVASSSAPVASAAVSVTVTAPGKAAVVVGKGKTLTDGTFSISVPLKVSGQLKVVYAGAAGIPAATVELGAVTATNWDTALTMNGVTSGTSVTLTGVVTASYADTEAGPKGLKVKLYFTPTSTGVPALATSATTTTNGAFTVKVTPKASGTYTAVISDLAGYNTGYSGGVAVTVN